MHINPNLDFLVKDFQNIVLYSLAYYVKESTLGNGFIFDTDADVYGAIGRLDSELKELGGIDDRIKEIIFTWGSLAYVSPQDVNSLNFVLWGPGASGYNKINDILVQIKFDLQDTSIINQTYDIKLNKALQYGLGDPNKPTLAKINGWEYIRPCKSERVLKRSLERLEALWSNDYMMDELINLSDSGDKFATGMLHMLETARDYGGEAIANPYAIALTKLNWRKLTKRIGSKVDV